MPSRKPNPRIANMPRLSLAIPNAGPGRHLSLSGSKMEARSGLQGCGRLIDGLGTAIRAGDDAREGRLPGCAQHKLGIADPKRVAAGDEDAGVLKSLRTLVDHVRPVALHLRDFDGVGLAALIGTGPGALP